MNTLAAAPFRFSNRPEPASMVMVPDPAVGAFAGGGAALLAETVEKAITLPSMRARAAAIPCIISI
jgi:hypothetical protein